MNDNVEVDLENTLIMRCIHCYHNLVIEINPKTQLKKRSISYYNTNGITSLKKHVDENHSLITKSFEEKMNSLLKSIEERQPSKKRTNLFGRSISKNNYVKDSFKKKDVPQIFYI